MTPRVKAELSSGDDDEANMDVELPDEEELHELDFREFGESDYEPSTEDTLEEINPWDEYDDL